MTTTERDVLRAALKPFADFADYMVKAHMSQFEDDYLAGGIFTLGQCLDARDALQLDLAQVRAERDAAAELHREWVEGPNGLKWYIAQVRVMTEALEIIAGRRQCADNLMSNVDVAEAALKHKP